MLWNGGQKERVKRRENYGLLIRQVVGGGARPFLFVNNTGNWLESRWGKN